jgi:fructokinase
VAEIFGGVETGGTWCVCALGTGPENLLEVEEFPTSSPGETLERIVAFFRDRALPAAIGIGSFGPLDLDPRSPTWGNVTTTPKPGWRDAPVASVIQGRLGVPVTLDTDVNAAALGEHIWGAGRGLDNLCYLTVGTGIGAGLIVDDVPLRGLIHPEVGHMRVPREAEIDPFSGCCPWHGDCWEGLASGAAISARWGAPADELPDDHPAWPLEASYLASGILNIVSVASPRRVITGGGVLDRPGLLPLVREVLRDLVAGYLPTQLLAERIDEYLVKPELGDRAGVLGAIALAQRMNARMHDAR